jgi:glycerophosphoryl diester phosphodiesterase
LYELLFEMDWVPGYRSDALTVAFTLITQLASSWFLLFFLPLGFWLWRKGAFGRLAVLNLLTLLLHSHLKEVYMAPRPDSSFSLVGVSGWSFPSGHAQHAVVTWMWLAWEIGKPWSWVTGTFLTITIALSRVYLGVHFGRDVLAGALVGAATLGWFQWLVATKPGWWQNRHWLWLLGMLLLFQLTWLALLRNRTAPLGYIPAAVVLGFSIGLLARNFEVFARLGQKGCVLLTAVLAGSILLAIRTGGYFSIDSAVPVLLHFMMWGTWMSLIAPGLLQKLRLGER